MSKCPKYLSGQIQISSLLFLVPILTNYISPILRDTTNKRKLFPQVFKQKQVLNITGNKIISQNIFPKAL